MGAKSTTYKAPKGGQKPVKPTRDPARPAPASGAGKASVKVGLPKPSSPTLNKTTGNGDN